MHRFLNRLFGARPTAPKPTHRPRLEVLEDRAVPTILFGSTAGKSVVDLGSTIIPNAHVHLIFWGSGWNTGSNPTLRSNVETAVNSIVSGPYMDKLSQYRNIGHASHFNSDDLTITSSSPPTSFTRTDVENLLGAKIKDKTLPSPDSDAQLLYVVFPQPGSGSGTEAGAHSYLDYGSGHNNAHYAYTINDGKLDTLTKVFSHELVESVTDPEGSGFAVTPPDAGSTGWFEICDGQAAQYSYRLNNYLVQSYFSAQDTAYVVPTGQAHNFRVSQSLELTVSGDNWYSNWIALDDVAGSVRAFLNGDTAQFEPYTINSIVVNSDPGLGISTDTVQVQGNRVPVTIYSLGLADTVEVGQLYNTLDRIQASVKVHNYTASTLNVTDTSTFFLPAQTYTLSGSTIRRDDSGLISFDGVPFSSVNLKGSDGADTYVVNNTQASSPTTIQAGHSSLSLSSSEFVVRGTTGPLGITGRGGLNVVSVGDDGRLDKVQGDVSVSNAGGAVALTIDDSNDATGRDVCLTGGDLTFGGPHFTFGDVAGLTIDGGGGNNTFNVSGTPAGADVVLKGGTGTDTLSYQAYPGNVLVNLRRGEATGFSAVSRIRNVVGATGGPAGSYNVLIGDGNNVLYGGNGRRNLLVAGASASTLVGGDDEDVLIAGTTDYDASASWQTAFGGIMAEWTQPTDYASRVDHLQNGGGLNDPYLLNATTVHSNGGGNVLIGHPGSTPETDLYFAALSDVTDWDASRGEQLVAIV